MLDQDIYWPAMSPTYRKHLDPKRDIDMFKISAEAAHDLHLAAYFGSRELVELWVSQEDEIDKSDFLGVTAVHWAILGCQHSMVELLLQRGASVQGRSKPSILRRRTSQGEVFVGVPSSNKPLEMAASLGNITAVELLLSYGGKVNECSPPDHIMTCSSDDAESALTVAISHNHNAVADLLLERGADVNADQTLFRYIDRHCDVHLLRYLVATGASRCSIDIAFAWSGRRFDRNLFLSIIKDECIGMDTALSDIKINDLQDKFTSRLPLIEATWLRKYSWTNGASDYMKLLISSGATMDCVGHCNFGYDYANHLEYIYGSTFDYTMKKHEHRNGGTNSIFVAPTSVRIWEGQTSPIHVAAFFRNLDAMRLLIREGAEVNFVTADDHLPLMSALSSESYIGYGRDNKIRDDDYGTNIEISPLAIKEVLQLLIDHGADPSLCSPDSQTRINQLLNLSSEESEDLRSLARPIAQPQWPQVCRWSFKERKEELEMAIQDGADPTLCCRRDQERIRRCLEWTEAEIEDFDDKRLTLIRCFINTDFHRSSLLVPESDSE